METTRYPARQRRSLEKYESQGVKLAAWSARFPDPMNVRGCCGKLTKPTAHWTFLINNAAVTSPWDLPLKDFPHDDWLNFWAVNMHTPFLLSKLALDDMLPRGSVVKIGSGAAVGPGRGPYPDAREVGAVAYGTTKAALERFTQGFAVEVYRYGASVTCLSPSQIVPSWANVREGLVDSIDDPRGEWPNVMAQAALLLASEPLDKVTGRVCYSQQILKEFGWVTEAKGTGVDADLLGSGYSQI